MTLDGYPAISAHAALILITCWFKQSEREKIYFWKSTPSSLTEGRQTLSWSVIFTLLNYKVDVSGPPGWCHLRVAGVGALMTQRRGLTNDTPLLLLGFLSDRSPDADTHRRDTDRVSEPADTLLHIQQRAAAVWRTHLRLEAPRGDAPSVPPRSVEILPPGSSGTLTPEETGFFFKKRGASAGWVTSRWYPRLKFYL